MSWGAKISTLVQGAPRHISHLKVQTIKSHHLYPSMPTIKKNLKLQQETIKFETFV